MSQIMETIKAAYEKDQQRKGRKVTRASELPVCFEDITSEWLTDVLCSKTPGAKVTAMQLGPVDSGSSNRRRIKIEYNDAGRAARLPTGIFCKATHDLQNRIVLGVSGGAEVEANFYGYLRPLFDIEAPVPHFARYEPDTYNSLIMLTDITDTVTEFCSHLTTMTRARAESQMRLLAKVHGTGYSSPAARKELQRLGTWPEFFKRTLGFGIKDGSNAGFLAGEEVIPPRVFKRYEEIWPRTLESVEMHNSLPLTLMHGDVHLKNWYVAGNGEMGLSDWQCSGRGHWGRDMAYAFTTALTVENRRAWEKELIRFYLEQLHAAGGPKVSFEEAWKHYRQQMMTVLTWWTITLRPTPDMPDMQPRDITMEFIRRITVAMDDIDTLGSFS